MSDDGVQGESIDEINSELTEIIKLQKIAAEAETEKAAVNVYDVIIGKLKVHIKSRVKNTETLEDDEELAKILLKYKDLRVEVVRKKSWVKEGNHVIIFWLGDDHTTKNIVPIEVAESEMRDMTELAYARLKEKKMEMYDALMEIICDEFYLNENLTDRGMTPSRLSGRYQ